ncbi:MAG: hypothetical protein LBV74_16555 [Tannerella sp.]|jgi:hypothetical protein|nr:hypothetical protein [Tannerella sp.]
MKTFDTMKLATAYINETLRIDGLQYKYGSYSYDDKGNIHRKTGKDRRENQLNN